MNKQSGDWGDKYKIFDNGIFSVELIVIKKGGYCSEHHHLGRTNLFHVLEGELEITIFREKDWPQIIDSPDKTILKAGESTEIKPMAYDPEKPELIHKFKAITNVKCIEICEARLYEKDIIRRTRGGVEKA